MNKLLRILIIAAQICTAALFIAACIDGLQKVNWKNVTLMECALRCFIITVFTIFYYSSVKGGFGSETLLIPLFLFFSTITEVRSINLYFEIIHNIHCSPGEIVDIFIFTNLMSVISIMGYCLYYSNQDVSGVLRYMATGSLGTIIITIFIPKTQSISNLWNIRAFKTLMYIIYATAVIVCIILIITDTPGLSLYRHIIALLLIISNYINLFYSTIVMDTIGTAFLFIASVIIITVTKRNRIKM